MEKEIPRPSEARPGAEWAARAQGWRSDRRVAAALLACLAVAGGIAWYRSGASAASPPAAPPATSGTFGGASSTYTASSTTTRPAAAIVVVDVVGAVRRSGVVRVHAGAHVVDAVTAAGGATPDADLVRLNLAAPVVDGMRVAVPRRGASAPEVDPGAVTGSPGAAGAGASGTSSAASGSGGGPSPGAPVDLNTATADQLDALPGIGPATAAAIVADRAANGPFRSVDDLGRVRGIGDAKLQKLRGLVTV